MLTLVRSSAVSHAGAVFSLIVGTVPSLWAYDWIVIVPDMYIDGICVLCSDVRGKH